MKLKETFEKQGGFNLIKQYWKSGALATAIGEFLLLGKSRTSLEILRLAGTLKTKQKLRKKYAYLLNEFDQKYDSTVEHKKSNKVWICWFQGMENAPELVKNCYHSLKNNLPTKEIIVLTKDNFKKYVTFPDYIYKKWQKGIITNTHMTDLLRLELLTQYGGTWIDSTVLCTSYEANIPDYFFNSELFFFQCLKPGRDGHATYMSSWYINAKSHNRILEATKMLCYAYWQSNNSLSDYFLLHDFLSIALENYPNEWHQIVPRDNATPHELLLRLFDNYDEQMWDAITAQTPFHKLSYKFTNEQKRKKGTFYQVIKDRFI
ncbi:capsular polysaccharide synthesis protein [Lactobacillus delbrueckii subsp. bulgaricus]|nr:capsular biosynthesis protein [Lactobacillus delbrueckii subsp. bulgaricus]